VHHLGDDAARRCFSESADFHGTGFHDCSLVS
jgi:hypothetical protein